MAFARAPRVCSGSAERTSDNGIRASAGTAFAAPTHMKRRDHDGTTATMPINMTTPFL